MRLCVSLSVFVCICLHLFMNKCLFAAVEARARTELLTPFIWTLPTICCAELYFNGSLFPNGLEMDSVMYLLASLYCPSVRVFPVGHIITISISKWLNFEAQVE